MIRLRARKWNRFHKIVGAFTARAGRRGVALAWTAIVALTVIAPRPAQAGATPELVISPASSEIFINGDCNNPVVWVNGEVRLYGSPYPQNGFMGGVATYKSGAALESLSATSDVSPDRTVLGHSVPPAFGPWFESIISDDDGVLWAYYHAEFPNEDQTKVHPRIGAQVSRDQGETWTDLGIVLDTPSGTDELHSWLGYGFSGGNGDFTAILDPQKTYVYFFYSQYGFTVAAQGIAVARMRWADRNDPIGKVKKWFNGAWEESGLGGQTTPMLPNVGDVHGLRAGFDFWWGPSIHWNTHLQRYVILLNRSNTADFTYENGVANWFMTSSSLDDPSQWDQPQPLSFPDGYEGSWYPQVAGTAVGETDALAGKVARLFVHGYSGWNITFLRPGESIGDPAPETAPAVFNPRPVLQITVGDGASDLEVAPGTTLPITGRATDSDGDMSEHWLEIRNPDGVWSWEGWLTSEPWAGALWGNGYSSVKSTSFTFDQPGTYTVRTSAIDSAGLWQVSAEVHVTVGQSSLPRVQVALNGSANNFEIAVGTALTVTGRASDLDGNMTEHWLEIRNPAGQWSWEGWLLQEPWAGGLVGDGSLSVKSARFTFNQVGNYLVRSTATDPSGGWSCSTELQIHVVDTSGVPPN